MMLATLLLALPAQDIHCSQVDLEIPAPYLMSASSLRRSLDREGRWVTVEGSGSPNAPLLTFEQPSPGGPWEFRGALEFVQPNFPFVRSWDMELEEDGSLTLMVGEPKWANPSGVERGRVRYLRWDSTTDFWEQEQVIIHPTPGFLRFGERIARDGDWAAISAAGLGEPSFFYERNPATDVWTLQGEVPEVGRPIDLEASRLLFDTSQGLAVYERDASDLWQQTAVLPDAIMESQLLGNEILARVNVSIPVGGQFFSTGQLRVYRQAQAGGPWLIEQTLDARDFEPGVWVPLDFFDFEASSELLVASGAYNDPPGGPANAGRAFAYVRDPETGNWRPSLVLEREGVVEPDEFFGSQFAVSGFTAVISTGAFPLEERELWSLDLDPTDLNADGTVDVCQSVGTVYCNPANPNSTLLPGRIGGLGSALLSDAALELCSDQLPPNEFGYLLGSSAPGFVPGVGGSSGNLCLAGGPDFGRFTDQVGSSGSEGLSCVTLNLPVVPTAQGPRTLLAGETWYFQYWYRDGATSNHTPGLEVVFD